VFHRSAHVYDLLYEAAGKDYAAESVAIHDLVQARTPGATSLLDVACGTGGHLVHLRRWYEVVGVELDPGMLVEARRRLPDVELVEGDMRSFRLDLRFDAVTCLFSSIGYMPSPQDLDASVATMAAHLRPGGVFVMDGWIEPEEWNDDHGVHVLTASNEHVSVARIGRSRRDGDKTFLDMHHLIGSRTGIEHVVDVHEMTLFDREQYETALQRAGLHEIHAVPSPMHGRSRYVGLAPHP
jgi:SAM-dependent methyltransferase